MAQAAVKVLEFPSGGIADFYMEDDDVATLEREEAKKAFGNNGIANFSDVANRMASYGRGGDDTLAHVATGEIVIPLPLIANNPKMKASIFKHLEELGVEDPEQYVVGSSANSINPETGLREFGWLSKTFKKVTRAVKKVGKSVVKLIKKAAPIVLPIALSFTPLGAIYGAALGSGIGTLIQGGSLKDAFKSALIAGASGAVFKGLGNKLSGQGTFMEGVKNAAANPMGRITQTASGLGSTLSSGGFTGQGNLFSNFDPTASVEAVADTTNLASEQLALDTDLKVPEVRNYGSRATNGSTDFLGDTAFTGTDQSMSNYNAQTGQFDLGNTQINTPPAERTFFEKTKDYMFSGGKSPTDISVAKDIAGQDYVAKMNRLGVPTTEAGLKAAEASAGPGMLATYGPTTALGLGAAALGGAFKAPDDPEEPDQETGLDRIRLNPDDYLLPGQTPAGATGPVKVATSYGYDPRAYTKYNPFQRVAEGGEIFPRRVGGIMPNEGTPGKDSVRAMLMPGEFVMTTDAVKGLGNGNNDQGINNMYEMMRGLESKGRAMA